MCKASQAAKNTENVVEGKTYGIGTSAHYLAALHPVGKTAAQVVACAITGTKLTLSNIPVDLQQKIGMGPTALAVFLQTDDNKQDALLFGEREVSLSEFANRGIVVFVGVKREHDTTAAVEALKAAAVKPAKAKKGIGARLLEIVRS